MDCGNHEYGHNSSLLRNSNEEENQLKLSTLNEHCLLKVFDYLYINDLINLGRTCKQLKKVSQMAATKFKRFSHDEYKHYKCTAQSPFSVGKILSYISHHIESLDLTDSFTGLGLEFLRATAPESEYELCFALTKVNFPKLKSLIVDSSSDLKCIHAHSVHTLEIRQLNRSDLNNFTFGLTNLKQLTLANIDSDVSTEELRYFLEKNANIECIEFYDTIPHQLRNDNFPKLKNLKEVEFVIGRNIPNLTYLLQLEELTMLKVEFRDTFSSHSEAKVNVIDEFLRELAKKRTLKSLELTSMNFKNDSLFETLSLLNLVSLRILYPLHCEDFFSKMAKTSFPSLTDLDILDETDFHETLFFITHLKAFELKRLTLWHKKKYNSRMFLELLSELLHQLKKTTCTRPILELKNMMEQDTVKIYFNLGYYAVVGNVKYDQPITYMFEPQEEMINP